MSFSPIFLHLIIGFAILTTSKITSQTADNQILKTNKEKIEHHHDSYHSSSDNLEEGKAYNLVKSLDLKLLKSRLIKEADANNQDFEVVIVDDCSNNENRIDNVESDFPHLNIKFIRINQKYGFNPSLAYNVAAIPEVVINNENGFVVNDIEEMKIKLDDVINLNRSGVRNSALKRFDIKFISRVYLNLFS